MSIRGHPGHGRIHHKSGRTTGSEDKAKLTDSGVLIQPTELRVAAGDFPNPAGVHLVFKKRMHDVWIIEGRLPSRFTMFQGETHCIRSRGWVHDRAHWNGGGNAERNAFPQDVKIIGIWVGAKQGQAMPQIETERLAVEDGQKRSPSRVRVDMKERAQVGQEWSKLVFGERIRLRAGEQTGSNLLMQTGVKESLAPGLAEATQSIGLRRRKRRSRTAQASAVLDTPRRRGPARCGR